jgi:hypothetical protein
MTTLKNSKPVLAEVLVRQVFGEAENFERVCAQRGVSVEQAVSQALRGWVGHGLSLVQDASPDPATDPEGLQRTNRSIETYIQAQAALRERVA